MRVARRTPGFSGADLANLLNEAAILTARRRKDAITILAIDDAVDRVVAGMEGTPLTDGKSKRLIAYHEIGHATRRYISQRPRSRTKGNSNSSRTSSRFNLVLLLMKIKV